MPDYMQLLITALRRCVDGILKEYNCTRQEILVRFETYYDPTNDAINLTTIFQFHKNTTYSKDKTYRIHRYLDTDVTEEYERIAQQMSLELEEFIVCHISRPKRAKQIKELKEPTTRQLMII